FLRSFHWPSNAGGPGLSRKDFRIKLGAFPLKGSRRSSGCGKGKRRVPVTWVSVFWVEVAKTGLFFVGKGFRDRLLAGKERRLAPEKPLFPKGPFKRKKKRAMIRFL